MSAIVYAFTEAGKRTARRIVDALGGIGCDSRVLVPPRLAGEGFAAYEGSLSDSAGRAFGGDALIFVGACGIAVRAVAPHVADKRTDPAVLCVDEQARYVIPLLSGHIGGANRLAEKLASALGATPVLTTATDVNGRFSVDGWAARNGLFISDMALAKKVSARILEGDIPICADRPLPEALPEGLVPGNAGALGICVSVRDARPFDETLLLVPRALRVGIGCRRGADAEAIGRLIDRALLAHGLRPEAVAEAASIHLKRDEAGLNACCRKRGWPIAFHSAEALENVPGEFDESEFVRRTVGVGNVCERAALAGGGRLIVPKTAENGVTVAIAELEWGIDFGRD